jgi:inorganic pyrophosphatase
MPSHSDKREEELTPWETPNHLPHTPWHTVQIGPIDKLLAFIEIPKGSKYKYEMHKPSGVVMVDRVLSSSVHYPANYGFLPRTYCDDNDPLDILVIGQEPVYPGVLMQARPIGVMTMIDNMERDDKVIAVHADDPEYSHYNDISQFAEHKWRELERFFLDYKALEKGDRTVTIEKFSGRDEAVNVIMESIDLYKKNYFNPKIPRITH